MELKISLMKNVLTGLLEEVSDAEKKIKKSGIVPRELCDLCLTSNKRNIVNLSTKERKNLENFKIWISKNQIEAISKSRLEKFFFKTKEKISGLKPDATDENSFIYAFRPALSKKMEYLSKAEKFLSNFDEIETCKHFVENNQNILKIEFQTNADIQPVGYNDIDYIPSDLFSGSIVKNKLVLCCDECKKFFENSMCNCIIKSGFIYDYGCPLQDILLRKRLEENKLTFENLLEAHSDEVEAHYAWHNYFYFLKQNSILIFVPSDYRRSRNVEKLKEFTKYLEPELITVFENYSNLPSYLALNTNLLFFHQDKVYFYNKNRPIEGDIKKICDLVAKKLNDLIETQRGKEHDRIISALYLIGQELGYVPQREYKKSGVIIDCVWFNKEGKIRVAIEVETSSTWKKDLISTWEVEPELAVIVSYTKTDIITKNLIESTLMKDIPHYLFYINKLTNHAFLFIKQEIVGNYNLEEENENLNEHNNV